jgi:hypothetical protein
VSAERIETVVIESFAKLGVVVAERMGLPAYFAIEAFVVKSPFSSRAS